MRKLVLAAVAVMFATGAGAVSVMEIAGKCGDDAKVYCEGIGYGDAMTECLAQHRTKLQPACKVIVERIENGEKVSLF